MININYFKQKYIHANVFMIVMLLILVFLPIQAKAAPPGMLDITFEFKPPHEDVESVHLAGSFNNWSTTATPMKDEDGDGVYEVTISLKPGEYLYKFVINGNDWMRDPNNDNTAPDGFGGRNSVLVVKEKKGSDEEGKIGDGKIFTDSIWHNQKERKFLNRMEENKIAVRLQTKRHDVSDVIVRYMDKTGTHSIPLNHHATNDGFDYWRTEIKFSGEKLKYRFKIQDKEKKVWYGENGVDDQKADWYSFSLQDQDVFQTPDWVKEAVFYQIFPDRFSNGNPDNDPELIETYKNDTERYKNITPEWHQGVLFTTHHYIDPDKFSDETSRIYPKSGWHIFYGGDLQGVEQKFDYLKELGVNAIYFNPIFEATANHRYNTAAYENIDDNLAIKGDHNASEEYFKRFIKKAHERDIKIILDAVFNHGGYEHYAFQDVINKGRDSDYSDWFFIESYPINTLYEQRTQGKEPNYKCWAGFGAHPKFNVANPEVKEYFFRITRKWMDPDGDGDPSDGIDGWRLDVANEVKDTDPNFWKEWRQLVKDINPDAYITGEIWNNASHYLQGNEFDGVMNYKFRNAVINFIANNKLSSEEFINEMNVTNVDYPVQSIFSLQNLIDSHDTERFLDTVDNNEKKLKLAALLQFTYPGAPMIYYGDEVGLDGGKDPDCRRTMIWQERPNGDKPNKQLYKYYSELAQIRRSHPTLIKGNTSFFIPDNTRSVVGMVRSYDDNKIVVLLNSWDTTQEINFSVNDKFHKGEDLLNGQEINIKNGRVNIKLPDNSGLIIKFKK